jgi:hypothetical protein
MIHVLIVEKTSSDQRIVASSRNRQDNPTSSGTSSSPTTTTATTATMAKTAKTWSEDSFTSEATAHFAALGMNTTHARVQEHGPWTNVNIGWIAGSVYIIFSVAKYLHWEMKSYTLRPDTFTLNFNVTLSGPSTSLPPSSPFSGAVSLSWSGV